MTEKENMEHIKKVRNTVEVTEEDCICMQTGGEKSFKAKGGSMLSLCMLMEEIKPLITEDKSFRVEFNYNQETQQVATLLFSPGLQNEKEKFQTYASVYKQKVGDGRELEVKISAKVEKPSSQEQLEKIVSEFAMISRRFYMDFAGKLNENLKGNGHE